MFGLYTFTFYWPATDLVEVKESEVTSKAQSQSTFLAKHPCLFQPRATSWRHSLLLLSTTP